MQHERAVRETWPDKALLFFAGFFTGAYGAGGPLLVIYCSKHYPEKEQFRVMQFICGGATMVVSCVIYAKMGYYTTASVPYIIAGIVAIAAGFLLCVKISSKIKTSTFQKLVNMVLLISAITMIVQALG